MYKKYMLLLLDSHLSHVLYMVFQSVEWVDAPLTSHLDENKTKQYNVCLNRLDIAYLRLG